MPLWGRLEQVAKVTEPVLARVYSDMLRALASIHEQGIVHCDVKPDNFLFSGTLHDGIVKLCDFGLSAVVSSQRKEMMGVKGTAPFMPPEMLQGGGFDTKADVWSFGVTAYVLLLGHFPYQPAVATASAMKRAIRFGMPGPSFKPKEGMLKQKSGISE